ncbi:MAG: SpoIIE family protein phosphatase [Opitutales bacterium]
MKVCLLGDTENSAHLVSQTSHPAWQWDIVAIEPMVPQDVDVLLVDLRQPLALEGGYLSFARRHSRASTKTPVVLACSEADLEGLRDEIDFSTAIGRNVFVTLAESEALSATLAAAFEWRRRALSFSALAPELPLPKQSEVEDIVAHRDLLFELLMNFLPDNIYFKDRDSRFLLVNQAMADKFRLPEPEALIGLTDHDFFGKEHAAAAREDELELLNGRVDIIRKLEKEDWPDGHTTWAQTTKLPIRTDEQEIIGTFGVSRDITSEREMDLKLQRERKLIRTLINLLPARVYVKDEDLRYTFNNSEHMRYLGLNEQSEAIGHRLRDFIDNAWARRVEAADRQIIAEGISVRNLEEYDESLNKWMLVNKVPLREEADRIVGLVGMSIDVTNQKRLEQTLKARNREMETELDLARALQQTFLPQHYPPLSAPTPDGHCRLEFAHHYRPSFTLGGDFLSIQALSESTASVLLCDVMGHGVRAALVTAMLRALTGELRSKADDPAQFVGALNHLLHDSLTDGSQLIFVTAFYGLIDLSSGRLRYCNAGSNCALVIRSPQELEKLDCGGQCDPALGLFSDFAFHVYETSLRCGSELICYTDGVIEASNADGEEFSEQRLFDQLRELPAAGKPRHFDKLMENLQAFCETDAFEDDICLFSARVVPEADT